MSHVVACHSSGMELIGGGGVMGVLASGLVNMRLQASGGGKVSQLQTVVWSSSPSDSPQLIPSTLAAESEPHHRILSLAFGDCDVPVVPLAACSAVSENSGAVRKESLNQDLSTCGCKPSVVARSPVCIPRCGDRLLQMHISLCHQLLRLKASNATAGYHKELVHAIY